MERDCFVHPTAVVGETAKIGSGTKIWHFCHVMSGAQVGENCVIGQNVFISSKAIVGNNIKIQNNVSVFDGVILEDGVFCGPSMVFTNVFNPRSFISRMKELRKTLVRKGATLGANSTDRVRKHHRTVCLCGSRFRGDQRSPGLCPRLRKPGKGPWLGLRVRGGDHRFDPGKPPANPAGKNIRRTATG